MKMRGILAVVIEIAAFSAAWIVYHRDYGTGAGSATYMLWGIAIAVVGSALGGILGIIGKVAPGSGYKL